MNWTNYWYDVLDGLHTEAGVVYIVFPLVACAIGVYIAENRIRRFRRSCLAPLGVALLAVVGWNVNSLIWFAMPATVLQSDASILQFIGMITFPAIAAWIGFWHSYKISNEEACNTTFIFVIVASLSMFGLESLLPK